MQRTCYHFIDRLRNINVADGNAWAGITNAGGDTPSGNGDALDIHSVADGGFPTMDSYGIKYSPNSPVYLKIFTDGINDGLPRLVSKPTRDAEEPFTTHGGSNISNDFGFIYAKVEDGVNGAVFDVNDDVNQLSRTYDDICKDRLPFTGKADLCVGLDFSDAYWSNIDYANVDEVSSRCIFLPFLDPVTGKLKPTPKTRWSQFYNWTNTDGIVGISFVVQFSRAWSNAGTNNIPYLICRVMATFEDGDQQQISYFTRAIEPESAFQRNIILSNTRWEFWMNATGVFRILRRNRPDNAIEEIVGGSDFEFDKKFFPDDNLGAGSQSVPFSFGLGYLGELGNNMVPETAEMSKIRYTFS